MLRRTRTWVGLLAILLSTSVLADPGDFPRPASLTVPIQFWKDVFTKYGKYDVILHDDFYLDKIVEVIDYSALAPPGLDEDMLRIWINKESDKALAHARRSFEEAQAAGDDPSKLTGQARRVWEMYKDFNGPNKYLAARDRLRLQHGIRERYARAITESSRYLPHMEETFRRKGLPIELTRLPFIESSFNVKAYSAAKAAGIWQFIPSAARLYMRLNTTVDDRRDPWFSTEAAARHLRDDYDALDSWPLAITAYNQGRYAMAKAYQELGTKDIGEIIQKYRGPRFKFAGRNFYVEFCAAMDIAADPQKYFGRGITRLPEIKFDEVVTKQRLSYETLRRMSGATKDEFLTLNPSYRPEVIHGKMMVPAGHRIRIPYGQLAAFNAAYDNSKTLLAAEERRADEEAAAETSSSTKGTRYHRVKRGDTLSAIARRYGKEVADIRKANGLKSVRTLRVGQRLKIPGKVVESVAGTDTTKEKTPARAPAVTAVAKSEPGKAKPAETVAARTTPDFEQAALVVEHKITAGQTLNKIAKQYGTSARAIQVANGITNMRSIRAGRVLKIPVGENYAQASTAKKSVVAAKSAPKLKTPSLIAAAVADEDKSAGKSESKGARQGMLADMLATTDIGPRGVLNSSPARTDKAANAKTAKPASTK